MLHLRLWPAICRKTVHVSASLAFETCPLSLQQPFPLGQDSMLNSNRQFRLNKFDNPHQWKLALDLRAREGASCLFSSDRVATNLQIK